MALPINIPVSSAKNQESMYERAHHPVLETRAFCAKRARTSPFWPETFVATNQMKKMKNHTA